jgi:hypothetical protein
LSAKPKYCFVRGLYVLLCPTLDSFPSFFVTSWTTSVTGMTCCWKDEGGDRNWYRSWPLCAATSELAVA